MYPCYAHSEICDVQRVHSMKRCHWKGWGIKGQYVSFIMMHALCFLRECILCDFVWHMYCLCQPVIALCSGPSFFHNIRFPLTACSWKSDWIESDIFHFSRVWERRALMILDNHAYFTIITMHTSELHVSRNTQQHVIFPLLWFLQTECNDK